jgi:excisionase family DNA binding protein
MYTRGVMGRVDSQPQRTQIMTLAEMAKYLGLHQMTVYRMLKSGRLPGFKLGRQWRTKKDVLDAWLMAQMHDNQRSPRRTRAHNGRVA